MGGRSGGVAALVVCLVGSATAADKAASPSKLKILTEEERQKARDERAEELDVRYSPYQCPYEPPLDQSGDFKRSAIAPRNYFPTIADPSSVLTPTGVMLGVDYSQTRLQRPLTGNALLRYGGGPIHLAFALDVPLDELESAGNPLPAALDHTPRAGVGAGYRSLDALLGGYVHYGYGVRGNVGFGGDSAIEVSGRPIVNVPPFDYVSSSDDAQLALTTELRFQLVGCYAWFAHLMLGGRADITSLATSLAVPLSLSFGFNPLSRITTGLEFALLFGRTADDDDSDLILRARAFMELHIAERVHLGASFHSLLSDGIRDFTLQTYLAVVP